MRASVVEALASVVPTELEELETGCSGGIELGLARALGAPAFGSYPLYTPVFDMICATTPVFPAFAKPNSTRVRLPGVRDPPEITSEGRAGWADWLNPEPQPAAHSAAHSSIALRTTPRGRPDRWVRVGRSGLITAA